MNLLGRLFFQRGRRWYCHPKREVPLSISSMARAGEGVPYSHFPLGHTCDQYFSFQGLISLRLHNIEYRI